MQAKRIQVVSLKMIKEGSFLYAPRTVTSPRAAADIFKRFLGDPDREHFVLLCLDTRNNPIYIQNVSIGSLSSSIVVPREVMKLAVLANAGSVIVAHNHPSSTTPPEASREDIEVTRRLVEAGTLLGIEVLDHVIVGDNDSYVSLKEKGLM